MREGCLKKQGKLPNITLVQIYYHLKVIIAFLSFSFYLFYKQLQFLLSSIIIINLVCFGFQPGEK